MLLASLTPGLVAQTDHTGECTGTFTAAGNPHRLVGSCTVPAGGTLTLGNGVILEGAGWTLVVDGQLNASGITFNQAALAYRDGSRGTLENSTLDGNTPITVSSTTNADSSVPVIRGNTINALTQAIIVMGTARPMITDNTITTNSMGIRYTGTDGGTTSGNVLRFATERGTNRTAIQVDADASPVVDDNSVEDDANRTDFGIVVNINVDSRARVTNNRVCATGDDVPLRLASGVFALGSAATVSGNTFPCGEAGGFGLFGPVSVDARYDTINGRSTFYPAAGLSVNSGVTLTIASGVTLNGRRNSLSIDGTVEADGVTIIDLPLNFRTGSGGTIENCMLSGQTPIAVGGSSVVDPADPVIRNNTIDASSIGIDVAQSARPTITGNAITHNSAGIRLGGTSSGTVSGNTISFLPEGGSRRSGISLTDGASPVVSDNIINDDPNRDDTGISVGVAAESTATVTGNEICVTGGDTAIFLSGEFFGAMGATVSGNTFPCGEATGFGLSGSLGVDGELRPVNGMSTFQQTSTLTVGAGATLTIATGLTIEGAGHSIVVNGNLMADGVTLNGVNVSYREGSGGTLRNSTLSTTNTISVSGNVAASPATPVIEGNTIIGTNLAIDISQRARPTVRNNVITTNNIALRYTNEAGGVARSNTINFTPQGGSRRTGVQINDAASPVIEENTLNDDPLASDVGIVVQGDAASVAVVRLNDICATGSDNPIVLEAGFFGSEMNATVADNNLVCGEAGGFGLFGTARVDSQLKPVNGMSTFHLTSTLTVEAGTTLTIPSRITIEGERHTINVDGMLDADGVTLSELFLSYRVGSGGTLENSAISGNQPISVTGNSTQNPASPLIRGNTIVTTGVAIDVSQTATPTITGNEITTSNVCIRYFNTAGGTISGNTLGFTPGMSSGRRAVELHDDASPLVQGNSVLDDPEVNDIGIQLLVDPGSTAVVTGNEICSTGLDRALDFAPGFFDQQMNARVEDNDLVCDTTVTAGLSGTVTTDSVLRPIEGRRAIYLTGSLNVQPGVTLTVPEGITLIGGGYTLNVSGTVNADGATFRRVLFSLRPGSSSTLQNSLFEGAPGTMVTASGGELTVVGNRFERLSNVFALTGAASLTAQDNLFRKNGIVVRIDSSSSSSVLADNVFEANENVASFRDAASVFSAFPEMLDTNWFQGSAREDTLLLPVTLNVSGTLRSAPVPYAIANSVTISSNVTVTLEPGTVLGFLRNSGLNVNGQLVANGSPERPIIFTGINLDSGFRWSGITITNKQSPADVTELRNCVVEFATTGLVLTNASIPVVDCLIADNSEHGISLTRSSPRIEGCTIVQNLEHGVVSAAGSNPVIEGCAIFGNGLNGIQNDDAAVTLAAENNFWGHDTGPRDADTDDACSTLSNPDGIGEDVSDCVDYDPWIRVGPSVEGTLAVLSGNGQQGATGELLPEPLVIETRSLIGSALADIEVIFSVVEGQAEILEEMPLRTSATGRASANVRLGEVPGDVVIAVTARDVNSPLASFMGETDAPCLIVLKAIGPPVALAGHLPGDLNQDASLNIADVLALLGHLYGGEVRDLPCLGGLEDDRNLSLVDWNGDGGANLADAVGELGFLFGGGPPHILGLDCFEVKACPGACGG